MYDKRQAIINSWVTFSKDENKNLAEFVNWASYYFEVPKSYIRNILADYNNQAEIKKREEEQEKIKEYENMIKEIMEEL